LQSVIDPILAVFRPFPEQERASDAASDAVIPASYGNIDEMRASHCHGWISEGDRLNLPKPPSQANYKLRVLAYTFRSSFYRPYLPNGVVLAASKRGTLIAF
jgi:hypothetical protein